MAGLDNDPDHSLYAVGDRVYYEDLAGDYCTILEVIEVYPFFQRVYRIRFDDGHVMHTTAEALRKERER